MKFNKSIFILFFVLALFLTPLKYVTAGLIPISETETQSFQLYSFFDLRDRESYIQITNTDSGPSDITVHVQVFNVNDNCNENNFYDTLTPNDTHVYNLRNVQTNNGNPSGVVLPQNAYGIVVVTNVVGVGGLSTSSPTSLIGNFRIIDDAGYEYRTNSHGYQNEIVQFSGSTNVHTFNYSNSNGVTLSDVVGILIDAAGESFDEVLVDDILASHIVFDVDIYNAQENVFSCRNIVFACTDQNNPRLEELLEFVEISSVASLEYGINEAIPHSKESPLLCPGNNISEGIVHLRQILLVCQAPPAFVGFVGLNSGNGRGSMDSFWNFNTLTFRL